MRCTGGALQLNRGGGLWEELEDYADVISRRRYKALAVCEQAENEDKLMSTGSISSRSSSNCRTLPKRSSFSTRRFRTGGLASNRRRRHQPVEAAPLLHFETTPPRLVPKKGQVNPAWKRRYLLLGRAPENTHAELFSSTMTNQRESSSKTRRPIGGIINFRKSKIDRLEGRMILSS